MKDFIYKHTKFYSGKNKEPFVDTESLLEELNQMSTKEIVDMFAEAWNNIRVVEKIKDVIEDYE